MSYTITVKTTDTTNRFSVVEETAHHNSGGGVWSEKDSVRRLVMGASGTSGTLRFVGAGEQFVVALGIHNYERWCDIVTDLAPGEDGAKIQYEYYTDTHFRYGMLWKQLDQIQRKSARGTAVDVKYVKQSGNSLFVHIFIASCD